MANKVIIFPVGQEAAANAYKAICDQHYAATYEPGGIWSYVQFDVFNQPVCPFYGPPWEFETGTPFTEPAECAALRATGILHDFAVWPDA